MHTMSAGAATQTARRAGGETPMRRYPTMIRTVREGASRAELTADLARLERLEPDPGWDASLAASKDWLRQRIAWLDRHGRDVEPRREALREAPGTGR